MFTETQLTLTLTLTLMAVTLIAVLVAWHRQQDHSLDLRDLVCTEDKLDEKKFMRFGAWLVSTWGFVYLIVEERFSEWYFVGYMAAWVGNAIVESVVKARPRQ